MRRGGSGWCCCLVDFHWSCVNVNGSGSEEAPIFAATQSHREARSLPEVCETEGVVVSDTASGSEPVFWCAKKTVFFVTILSHGRPLPSQGPSPSPMRRPAPSFISPSRVQLNRSGLDGSG